MDKAFTGAYGELAVGRYLRENGYNIVSANYRCRMGEIDIIASERKYICFVEVKTRSDNSLMKPCDAVDSQKQKRIITTAQFFLAHNAIKLQPRFDVAEVYMKNGGDVEINYIKNAYDGGGK